MAYPQSWTCPSCGNTVYNSDQCTICTYIPKELTKPKEAVKAAAGSKLLQRRILAFLVDVLIVLGISLAVIIGFVSMIFQSIGKDFFTTFLAFSVPFAIIPLVLHPVYHLFFEGRYNGQTFGKKFLKVRVVTLNGENIGFKESIVRNLVRLFEMATLYILSIVLIVRSNGEQRFGDKIAETIISEA